MYLSVIIPTLNEETHIEKLLTFLCDHQRTEFLEIIVVDGGSTDTTCSVVESFPDIRLLRSEEASRPVQMNLGAGVATSELFYFVHADVQLPDSFFEDLGQATETYDLGGYRYRFDGGPFLLKINAFFTRFPMMWCRGGDQTLFIKKDLFKQLDGFDERFCVLEDFDLIRRAKEQTAYRIIPKNVIVSARKYDHNGYFKVQLANLRAFRMYRKGIAPTEIRKFYKKTLHLVDY